MVLQRDLESVVLAVGREEEPWEVPVVCLSLLHELSPVMPV